MLKSINLAHAGLVLLVALLLVAPAVAQETGTAQNTITVTGTGKATASPDIATVDIGVEVPSTDIATAYSQVNSTIESIVEALVTLGVAREDIRTSGINIYSEPIMGPEGQSGYQYRVGNRVNVTVRDLALIENVMDTAVNSGANVIFGLQFGISDTAALENEARTKALDDARARAGHIAENIGVGLGDVVTVVEMSSGGFPPVYDGGFGGGAAVVEPGQLSVSLSIQVTFAMSR